MTSKKEALVFLTNHVGKGVVDQEVRELIEKYKKQLQNKTSPT